MQACQARNVRRRALQRGRQHLWPALPRGQFCPKSGFGSNGSSQTVGKARLLHRPKLCLRLAVPVDDQTAACAAPRLGGAGTTTGEDPEDRATGEPCADGLAASEHNSGELAAFLSCCDDLFCRVVGAKMPPLDVLSSSGTGPSSSSSVSVKPGETSR
mmetsp:Transcript_53696/g.148931  ORF Transcript_53696/g.148931 Transcript_53696/m.148931 type:complete len:158 (+) Transcript_53696:67-540(+)